MKLSQKNYKRIVIKIGSSLFYSGGVLDLQRFNDLVRQIVFLMQEEIKEVVVVSSGAIALGMGILGLKARPKELSYLQAAAAIGQNALMDSFSNEFKRQKIACAQVLLTWDDFDNRKRYLNAKSTLLTLLRLKSVPVINENDTISTDEIKVGDNDRLSALVSTMVNADLLIMLSDVDGLLDRDKKLVRQVEAITPAIRSLAMPTTRHTSVGGMITKIDAAKIASDSGIPCVIANGNRKGIITSVVADPLLAEHWTYFASKRESFAARDRWIAFGTKPKGKVAVDEGAKKALLNKKSLLSVGVVGMSGAFECGDIVSLVDIEGKEFARGKVCLSCSQLEKVKGKRSEKEVLHCDNIVILE